MRSQIKQIHKKKELTAESAKSAENSIRPMKLYILRVLQIILFIISVLLLINCDQVPTTLDEEPYIQGTEVNTFSVAVTAFEFDYLSQEFFISVAISSPEEISTSEAHLYLPQTINVASLSLNDDGLQGDIQVNDGSYDANWILPDSLSSYIDSLWTLEVSVSSGADLKQITQTLQPERPAPPLILSASHLDTLTLSIDGLVLDTLEVELTHPKGLDEIRDVSMMSLKPDGNYANNGQPIPLYDDGSSEVFFTFDSVDFTSGDRIANDGIYSLLLALTPTNLSGTYYWTFNARTWLGIAAEPLEDSLVVLPPPGLIKSAPNTNSMLGVFQ